MAQLNQLVGIIELDADPNLDAPADENIGQTLRRLRSGADGSHRSPGDGPLCAAGFHWQHTDPSPGAVVVLSADLRQLHCDLECEWARLLDQLLWLDT
jgi:hypothetical protein